MDETELEVTDSDNLLLREVQVDLFQIVNESWVSTQLFILDNMLTEVRKRTSSKSPFVIWTSLHKLRKYSACSLVQRLPVTKMY